MAEHFENKKKNWLTKIHRLVYSVAYFISQYPRLFSANFLINVKCLHSFLNWPQTFQKKFSYFLYRRLAGMFSAAAILFCSGTILASYLFIYFYFYNFCLVSYRWREKKIYFSHKFSLFSANMLGILFR
jgi:hypothetical protein